jgi:hypothetical protein
MHYKGCCESSGTCAGKFEKATQSYILTNNHTLTSKHIKEKLTFKYYMSCISIFLCMHIY